ncbi:DUF3006 family protein [Oceanobacillus chungangensis]|uniref:DUF3006 domain-containing protein n=1 Tax=Oceanobacillus chungangensis TaxID=1229152 RepID=A0A3D8PHC9_9BACI|nr:DUF3006 family protein [Oceanobacillus chungangensis]RDW15474.1 DUF3006 domain-containing protein [Oceanobacillus chungangensis]
MKGILDRFEGDKAVILIEEINEEFIIQKTELPSGSEQQTIFDLEKANDSYKILAIDASTTNAAAEKSANLMDRLRANSSGSKFIRNKK